MNVSKPEMSTALYYLAFAVEARIRRNKVVAIMLTSAKEGTLYTPWYWESSISYITMSERHKESCEDCTRSRV